MSSTTTAGRPGGSILVIGRTGQLAQHLQELLPQATFWSRSDADLAQPALLEERIAAMGTTAIVNAAAYTAVDRAESEPDLAWRINAEAPASMARAAAARNIPLIHVSTDYVFDGLSEREYRPTDPVAPLNVYGATKLAGEIAVRSLAKQHWILRTSWVFSEHGTNFVKTMLRLGRERDALNIVNDQRGRPTYAGDLARAIAALVKELDSNLVPAGTYHAVGGPALSWFEFAQEIFVRARALGILSKVPSVSAIPSSQYPTPAARPSNSVMEPSQLLQDALAVRFDWQAGLERALRHIGNTK